MYDYFDAAEKESMRTVGSFSQDKNVDFKQNVSQMLESFRSTYQMDAITDITKILRVSQIKEAYTDMLMADVDMEGISDEYYSTLPQKLEQLIENSSTEILKESGVANLAPIVGITLPVLKKNFIEGHSKDIVMTEIPTKPIVKAAFERRFLKDTAGNKYYIPDVFYDDTYKTVMAKGKGTAISATYYPVDPDGSTATLPIHDFNILTASGGSITNRDTLAMDFCIKGVQFLVDNTTYTVSNLNIQPNMAADSTFQCRIKAPAANSEGVVLEDILVGKVDFYWGTVSVASTGGYIKKVQFGGHLSNENNINTLELDRERELMEWKIPDGVRINTGLKLETIKDYKALFDIEYTTDIISDISTVLTQTEDSDVLGYLNDSFDSWAQRDVQPFGFTDGFVKKAWFSCEPPVNKFQLRSQYIATELKFELNRFIDELKVLLRHEDLMFVVYGHPNNVTLIQDDVRWIIDEDTKIGGIQLDYRFGFMAANKNRIHVISTLKCPKARGLRVVAYPLSKEVITFKHYKYALNIENTYRNPITPNVPNVMGTSRYITTEVLPVQGEFYLTNNGFATVQPSATPTAQVAAPVLANGSTSITVASADYSSGYPVVAYSTTTGAALYYTVDGTTPTVSSTPVPATGIITATSSATVKVIAAKTGMIPSTVSSVVVTLTT